MAKKMGMKPMMKAAVQPISVPAMAPKKPMNAQQFQTMRAAASPATNSTPMKQNVKARASKRGY